MPSCLTYGDLISPYFEFLAYLTLFNLPYMQSSYYVYALRVKCNHLLVEIIKIVKINPKMNEL